MWSMTLLFVLRLGHSTGHYDYVWIYICTSISICIYVFIYIIYYIYKALLEKDDMQAYCTEAYGLQDGGQSRVDWLAAE